MMLHHFYYNWKINYASEKASKKSKEFNTLLYQLMIDDTTNEILHNVSTSLLLIDDRLCYYILGHLDPVRTDREHDAGITTNCHYQPHNHTPTAFYDHLSVNCTI
ncbi:unnamed protein product [Nezara viridula]|uniref:Uncharacterized protein n=1 Tax=Nezara viridula TaxID=85310 RepID=A0A9P0H3P9_NEZVI|nr:unnamed protein product [Nezara viridula]